MIITLNDALTYLKIEKDDLSKAELDEIKSLISSAETYLLNATGIKYTGRNALAKLFCRMVVCDWYDDRGTVGSIKSGARDILAQLKYCTGDERK